LHGNKVLFYCLNKVLRLHLFDFNRTLSNSELYDQSGIRSFTSLSIINDCKMLLKLVTNPSNFCFTTNLMSLTSFSVRFPDKLIFFDASKHRAGRNRAKQISEIIPFEWLNLSLVTFSSRLKRAVPLNMA